MFMVPTAEHPLHIAVGKQSYRGRQVAEKTHSEAKSELQARQRAWLQEVVKATGMKPSQLAGVAGVSDTTLTRLLNNPTYRHTLTQLTIDRIKEKFQVPGPEEFAAVKGGIIGLGEAERLDVSALPAATARVIAAMLADRSSVEAWRLKTPALEQIGYLPGDVLMVDLRADPKPQDAVCAQVLDYTRGGLHTVFRVYDPPFLVGASSDRTAYKPLLVDNDRVIVKGVVVESLRPHRLSDTR